MMNVILGTNKVACMFNTYFFKYFLKRMAENKQLKKETVRSSPE